ncbi:MAG: hypoxanthine phosphoribosyltransferase [Chloroflexi bacterium]|nr:hypoxanthine phosphoribosyltransferase [Chloroflexota bacterium]
MRDDIAEVLLSEDQIHHRVAELGDEIARDYAGRDLLVLFVLKGALLFVADLIRTIDMHVQLDFMVVSSYGARTESSGSVRIVTDMRSDVKGRDVLIVEDIIDSGLTLREIIAHLQVREPASIEVCTLLNKPSRRRVELDVKYIGFEIPDAFVVGYCLDYNERYRNLPFIGVLKPELYAGA